LSSGHESAVTSADNEQSGSRSRTGGGRPSLLRPSAIRREREVSAGHWRDLMLDSYLSLAAEGHPDSVAVVDGDVVLTYSEVLAKVRSVARALRDLGVMNGDVVSWQLPNWLEAYITHFAVVSIGAVSNPIVSIYRHHEVEFILREAGSRVVITPDAFRGFGYASMIDDIRGNLPMLEHAVVTRPEKASPAISFGDLMAADDNGAGSFRGRTADDPALLMFTSGTTARPKGAVHTHNTLDFEVQSMIKVFDLVDSDVVFMPSPLTHMTGLAYGVQLAPALAVPLVLQDVWEPHKAMELIDAFKCSFTLLATPFLHSILHHPEQGTFDLTSMRVVASGGADVPAPLMRGIRTRMHCTASRAYGSTEMPTLTTTGPSGPAEKGATTDGRPVGPAMFRLVDDDGKTVGPGEVGEIIATGPELFIGYLRAEDNQGALAEDGWFHTGDLGSADADGYLTIQGRKKDIILRGGENISVTEVEHILLEHPSVRDIAIVAMPDPVMVERACAYVVPTEGVQPTLKELCDYLAERNLAKQKYPERLELIDELPRTPAGKVQKFPLRARIAEQLRADPGGA
jgi:cyclohexanecarboxylate-CoA ligase